MFYILKRQLVSVAAILKNKVRVLIPSEFEALMRVITKDSLKKLVQVLLLTGMRYVEVLRLKKYPGCFDPNRKVIHFKSGKKAAVNNERYIHLTPAGVTAVQAFIDDERVTYPSPQGMTLNLVRWSALAGLEASPELVNEIYNKGANDGRMRKNTGGMSVKTFRKSWESWLAISFPYKLDMIALSQGHETGTAIAHYLAVPFSDDEKAQILTYTAGWMEKNCCVK
jgi:integrase